VLRRAAVEARGVVIELAQRSREIAAAGFRPQVDEVPGLSLVFLNDHGVKRRLPLPEASALREREPAGESFLSSTVLLRPVIERAMLPTVAYLGGPGEIAYFAQVSAVADAVGVPRPLVLPRWSTTVIEPRIQRILDELGGVTADALADVHAVEARLARARLTPGAERALRALHDDLANDVGRLQSASDGLVPATVLDGLRRSLAHRLERLERRFLAAVKRREAETMRKLATARGALYPGGIRQERALAFIPLVARYGPALIDEMLEAAHAHARALVTDASRISASASVPPPARV